MKFSTAYIYLKRGHKIKCPEFGGYWYWDKTQQTIRVHTRGGRDLDIRETDDVDYTFGFINRNDWEIIDEEELIYDQKDAIEFIKLNQHYASQIRETAIKEVLDLEEDYMRSVGIIKD